MIHQSSSGLGSSRNGPVSAGPPRSRRPRAAGGSRGAVLSGVAGLGFFAIGRGCRPGKAGVIAEENRGLAARTMLGVVRTVAAGLRTRLISAIVLRVVRQMFDNSQHQTVESGHFVRKSVLSASKARFCTRKSRLPGMDTRFRSTSRPDRNSRRTSPYPVSFAPAVIWMWLPSRMRSSDRQGA
jgi:hypothetical protein